MQKNNKYDYLYECLFYGESSLTKTHLSLISTEEIKFFSSNIKYPPKHSRDIDGKNSYRIEMLITISQRNHHLNFQPCTNMERLELFGQNSFS